MRKTVWGAFYKRIVLPGALGGLRDTRLFYELARPFLIDDSPKDLSRRLNRAHPFLKVFLSPMLLLERYAALVFIIPFLRWRETSFIAIMYRGNDL